MRSVDLDGISSLINYIDITVKTDGTGDFLTPKLANDSITSSGYNKQYNIYIYEGIYTDINWKPKPYVNLIGINRDTCILRGELPDNSIDSDITAKSTVNLVYSSSLKNLTITCKNMRYPIHDDGGGTDKIRNVENCVFIHCGNEGARTWRDANPESGMLASTVWASENAYGSGANSGDIVKYKDNTFISPVNAWGTHNNENYEKPFYIEHENSNFILNSFNPSFHNAIGLAVMGSGNKDRIVFKGCKANSPIRYYVMHATTIDGMSDKAEFEISGYGNNLPFEVQLGGQRYVPRFNDECQNVMATELILKGQACCYASDMGHIRKMLTTDDKTLFAGIAINDIAINAFGDIKFKGYIEKEDLNLTTIVFGEKYGIGASGYLVVSTNHICVVVGYNNLKFI